MRRLYALLAGLGLFTAALGCHHHVAGICDCDSCEWGCCDYGLCCPCNGPGGPIPPIPAVAPGMVLSPTPTMVAPPTIMKELPKDGKAIPAPTPDGK
jgi:hypothetical protein